MQNLIPRRIAFWILLFGVAALGAGSSLRAASLNLTITEFLTSNSGGLNDLDEESPDWIEIYNGEPSLVNLGGWHLTDDPLNLTKWTFPVTPIASAGYRIVFASGKDRALPGQELHANFSLEEGGGYLALVEPDGVTVAHEYHYPAQRFNVSYGTGLQVSTETTLVGAMAPARLRVPTDGTLGGTWTGMAFDDSAWISTNTPVGFQVGMVDHVILAVDFSERGSSVLQPGFSVFEIDSVGGSTAIQNAPSTRTFGSMTVTVEGAGGETGYDDRLRSTPVDNGALTESFLLRDFVFSRDSLGNGGLDVTVTGLVPLRAYRMTIWSFDSSSKGNRVSDWSANGDAAIENYSFGGQNLPSSNGEYQFTFEAVANGSGAVVISGRRDATSVDANSAASFGVFLNALEVAELSNLPANEGLASLMVSNNATAYIRVPFTVTDPSAVSTLILRMQYDDGFVAHVNGQQVASANAPGNPAWNASAPSPHVALGFEEFPLVPPPGLLQTGLNVLAIQGLNVTAVDSDFLINVELIAQESSLAGQTYFSPPTPGADNGEGFVGLVADTKFSVDRGFYDAPFMVAITSATTNSQIYWSRDGSAPSPGSGTLYTGPLSVTNTTYLRAAAFRDGWVPSDVDTHTYLFLDEVLQQSANPPGFPTLWQGSYPADYGMDPAIVDHPNYGPSLKSDLRSIPTLSIVTTHENLWGSSVGIYNHATSEGPSWERAISAELINGDGTTEFAVNCGVQMQGNASRDNARTPKHAMRLLFKAQYGRGKLNYDWFPGPEDRFNTVVLRACFTDSWSTRYSDSTLIPGGRGTRYRPEDSLIMRDVWVKDTLRDMGWHSGRSDWVHLYLNGKYWGVYNPADRLDASHFVEAFGGRESDWDVIRDFSEVLAGNKTAWNQMMTLVNAGITSEPAYQALSQQVDVENLIDFMMIHIFAEAEDWPHHNWYAARRRAGNGLPATRWAFMSWDQEIVLDQLVRLNRINVSNNDTPARIYSQLRAYPEFRRLFGDRVQKHFFNGGALTPSNNVARLQQRAQQIDRAIVGESARWGDAREAAIGANPATGQTFTRDEWWIPELDKLHTNFLQNLTLENVQRFRGAGLYPPVDAPQFNQFGGNVAAGFELTMTHSAAPAGTVFFTVDGTDPREYGTAAVAPSAQAYVAAMGINTLTHVRARVLVNNDWSALVDARFFPPQDYQSLLLTEIMYNPLGQDGTNGAEFEFVELKNIGTETVDLTGLHFSEGILFPFTNGTFLGPGEFFVLGRNPGALTLRYPGLVVHGVFDSQLDNGGETLRLSHPVGSSIFSVEYNDEGRWPITPDGFGYSLVPIQPGNAPNSGRPVNWRASTFPGGSPGADDPEPVVHAILINEVLTHTDPPQTDSIELYNPHGVEVDLGGWYLTDDRKVPQKFRIPDGTMIGPGGYRLFTESDFNPTPGLGNSFTLSSLGEAIYLVAANPAMNLSGYSDGFEFGAAANGVSFGRYVVSTGDEHYPAQTALSLEGDNAGPRIGPVVISQIMYHPPDLISGADNRLGEYIELCNISGGDLPLFDAFGNTWKLRDAVDYVFPPGVTLPANARILVVPFDPADAFERGRFEATYSQLAGHPLFGPYTGKLDNSGERVELIRPDPPELNEVPEILVERVHYKDKLPWAPAADGTGAALQRISLASYGNDPANWSAAAPLSIRIQPQGMDVNPGDAINLSVLAVGSGNLSYQWYKNGLPLPGATSSLLTILNAQNDDQGSYHVTVSDTFASVASQPAWLGVLNPPVVLVPPLSQSVVEGGSVTFSILVSGHLPMSYRWRYSFFSLTNQSTLSHQHFHTIPNVQMSDAGSYTVALTNAVSFTPGVLSPAALLTVLADSDMDGLPDTWEMEHGLDELNPADAGLDSDLDGSSNADEYRAGTDPRNDDDFLNVNEIRVNAGMVTLEFLAVSNRTYSILYKDSLAASSWSKLADVVAEGASRMVTIQDPDGSASTLFYQLVTPVSP